MHGYTFLGSLLNGEAIFYSKANGLAIEQDLSHLVTATHEEILEIYKTKSHLKAIIDPKTLEGVIPHENALTDH